MTELLVKLAYLALFFSEANARLAFKTAYLILLMHIFALSAQPDSDLMEGNVLLLILTALDILCKIYLRSANLVPQDFTYHKEFA